MVKFQETVALVTVTLKILLEWVVMAKNKNKQDARPLVLITYLIWLTLMVAFATSLFSKDWLAAFVSAITFLLTFVPFVLKKRFSLQIPNVFLYAGTFFVYATLFLGELHGFYEKIAWWDIATHFTSAVGFGIIGMIILLSLYKRERIVASPFLLSLFAFSFGVAIGVVWEIFEFGMDHFFGLNMQKSGLPDTMLDLIVDALGAGAASIFGYIYMRRRKRITRNPMKDMVDEGASVVGG